MEPNLKRGTQIFQNKEVCQNEPCWPHSRNPAQDNPQNRGPVYGHFLIVLTLKEALGLSGSLSGFCARFLTAGGGAEPSPG